MMMSLMPSPLRSPAVTERCCSRSREELPWRVKPLVPLSAVTLRVETKGVVLPKMT